MSNPYFRQVPNFDYVNRLPNSNIGDYIQVKNIFKRGKLREDIFQDLTFFERYKIRGNDRPDNVAFDVYGDSTLDWLVLICNNIVNIQTEWPLTQDSFDSYLMNKYGDYETLYSGIHHYETTEVKNSQGVIIVPAGLEVPSGYSVSYYDYFTDEQIDTGDITLEVTNYEYEDKIENDKRNIYVIKKEYLSIILDNMSDLMEYKKGSSQYVSETLKRGDNIKLTS
jgi:hypothetical protein